MNDLAPALPFVAFLLASGAGATCVVWLGRRGAWRTAALLSLGVTAAAIIVWLIAIPEATLLSSAVVNAAITLYWAIVLPGAAGAAIAQARKATWMLVPAFIVMAALWLLMAYVGLFPMCTLMPECDL